MEISGATPSSAGAVVRAALLLLLLPLIVYRYAVFPALVSPLSKIPNAHWSSAVSPVWILYVRFRRRENRVLRTAHNRIGPVVRVGPYELSLDDMAGLRTVYQGGFDKTEWYSVFDNYGSVTRCSQEAC